MKSRVSSPACTATPTIFWTVLVVFIGLASMGCGNKDNSTTTGATPATPPASPDTPPPTKGTAEEVLDRMVQAYKNASSYGDAAVVELSGTKDGQRQALNFPHSIAFERPNKIRMEIDGGILICDGVNIYGFSQNPELANQVLKVPAPPQLSIKSLYFDRLLSSSMTQSPTQTFSWVPLQLMLLLAGDPVKTLEADARQKNLLQPAMIGEHACDRVQLITGNGPGVLWIDQTTSLLRRFEAPVDALRQQAEAGQFLDPALTIEFRQAQLNPTLPAEAFQVALPEGVKTADALTLPLLQVLGQPVPDFQVTDTDGKTIALSSFRDKVVVIQLWTSKSVPSRVVLQASSKAIAELESPDDVVVMPVCVEDGTVTNESLQAVFKDWGVELPIYRDLDQSIPKHYGISGVPFTIVIGKKGIVQSLQAGPLDNMDTLLVMLIEKLRSGEEVYRSAFKQFAGQQAAFDMAVDESVRDDIYYFRSSPPTAQLKPRSEPGNLKITKLWSCDQLKLPGNILVVPASDGPPRILVVDNGNSVAELNIDGSVKSTGSFELEGNEAVTALRTAVAADGKRYYLGTARGYRRVHLFDGEFKTLLVYPDVDNPGIHDALLADLTDNGSPEMVLGYVDVAGVQAADLTGNRLWADRSMVHAIRVAALTPDDAGRRNILAMNAEDGTIVELDPDGKHLRDIKVAGCAVGWVVADDLDGDGTSEICVLTIPTSTDGKPVASGTMDIQGIDLSGQALWSHPVAAGVHQTPIEPIVAGNVFPSGPAQWIIVTADSTISIIAADGKMVDSFTYGTQLSGVATAQWDGKPVLLVSTPQAVEAWQVEPSAAP